MSLVIGVTHALAVPGMDRYLEHPAVFPGLHNRLIVVLSELLQAAWPAPYYAEIGERVWVEVSQRFIEPYGIALCPDTGRERVEGPVAMADPRIRPVVVTVPHDERREPFVERVYDNGPHRLRIRYALAVPVPPLRADQAAWAADVTRGMES